jgi:hypothetical protein
VSAVASVDPTEARKATVRRFGRPTTPTRAKRPFDASVDPTDARKATVRRFGGSDRNALSNDPPPSADR